LICRRTAALDFAINDISSTTVADLTSTRCLSFAHQQTCQAAIFL
jgi:hypothetical protein